MYLQHANDMIAVLTQPTLCYQKESFIIDDFRDYFKKY